MKQTHTLPGVSEFLNQGFNLSQRVWRQAVALILIGIAPMIVGIVLSSLLGVLTHSPAVGGLVMLVALVGTVYTAIRCRMAYTRLMYGDHHQHSVRQLWNQTEGKFWQFFGQTLGYKFLLQGVRALGILPLIIGAVVTVGTLGAVGLVTGLPAAVGPLLYILLLIGLFVAVGSAVVLGFTLPLCVLQSGEHHVLRTALAHSRDMTAGHRWGILGRMLVAAVVPLLVCILVLIAMGALHGSSVVEIILACVFAVVFLGSCVFLSSSHAVLYRSLTHGHHERVVPVARWKLIVLVILGILATLVGLAVRGASMLIEAQMHASEGQVDSDGSPTSPDSGGFGTSGFGDGIPADANSTDGVAPDQTGTSPSTPTH